jgi:hypothetical protein
MQLVSRRSFASKMEAPVQATFQGRFLLGGKGSFL